MKGAMKSMKIMKAMASMLPKMKAMKGTSPKVTTMKAKKDTNTKNSMKTVKAMKAIKAKLPMKTMKEMKAMKAKNSKANATQPQKIQQKPWGIYDCVVQCCTPHCNSWVFMRKFGNVAPSVEPSGGSHSRRGPSGGLMLPPTKAPAWPAKSHFFQSEKS